MDFQVPGVGPAGLCSKQSPDLGSKNLALGLDAKSITCFGFCHVRVQSRRLNHKLYVNFNKPIV